MAALRQDLKRKTTRFPQHASTLEKKIQLFRRVPVLETGKADRAETSGLPILSFLEKVTKIWWDSETKNFDLMLQCSPEIPPMKRFLYILLAVVYDIALVRRGQLTR